MITRYVAAVTTGTFATLTILFAMQELIRLQPGAESEDRSRHFVDWIRVPRPEDPPKAREPLIDREKLVDAPHPPSDRPDQSGDTIRVARVPISSQAPLPTPLDGIGKPDGPLISIVRVQPVYPPGAIARGLEGWVDVRFDVMTNGLPTNIVAIASSHRLFERAAIDAARRFRFKPPVIDSTPQIAAGIEFRFRFTMND